MTDSERRLYTLQLSRRDLGWVVNALDHYQSTLECEGSRTPAKEVMNLMVWLAQVYEGAPERPAYFWLGEGAERISL